MLRNPFSPGKNHAYSRWGALTSIRTSDWRLINTNGDYDLYDLSSFRYEVSDISSSNEAVVGALSADLNIQGTGIATSYLQWSSGNPLLADPNGDADNDGAVNRFEYGSGSDPLDATDKPSVELTTEDLTDLGFTGDEKVYSFTVKSDADDLSLSPATSTDFLAWSFAPLEFLDATQLDDSTHRLRFRLTDQSDPKRFFRLDSGR